MVAVLDCGSQYLQLIVRRVRELKVYSEIFPPTVRAASLQRRGVRAVILSGGPGHISREGHLPVDREILEKFPVLGLCYGLQLIASMHGGKVASGKREYGKTTFFPESGELLFEGVSRPTTVWMSHQDYVASMPPGFVPLGRTENCPLAAMKNTKGTVYGLQFHPEVTHTLEGRKILANFLFKIAGLSPEWASSSMLARAEKMIATNVGQGKVICGLSGGVDSSCLAVFLHKVCGQRALSIFVNNGLLRQGEAEQIRDFFSGRVNLKYVDASTLFLKKLSGVADPERKRKIIGHTFIRVFQQEAKNFGATFLAQGTLYPDVIESTSPSGGPSARIKTHHNVGGLPEKLRLKLVEPFRFLFKDEVRKLARALKIPEAIINRQPFPGPGLAVRIIGSVTGERLTLLRKADAIVQEEIDRSPWKKKLWQSFAILLPVKTVGIMGDCRSYEHVVALRFVRSSDGMTADWARLPDSLLDRLSRRLVSEVKGINRVVYDITSKPPATIEWE
ncbi:MAG TPA: glutamine-hydrolyzing GMP synthase [bacterium]|nr:glutamine-hydrolyzing GMP synthase [bacterium]